MVPFRATRWKSKPHGRSPLWMHSDDGGGGIYEWEMLSVLLGLCLVIKYTRHIPAILFVGNQAAQAALISGAVKSDMASQICADFWALAASAGINVWGGLCTLEIKYCRFPLEGMRRS